MKRRYPEFTYARRGGALQLCCENHYQLEALLELDETHWAVTGIPVSALDMSPDFLSAMDTDKNGRIRTDEVRAAVRWTLEMLKDPSGLDNASDRLAVAAINDAAPEGKDIRDAAELVLHNLKSERDFVTLEEIDNDAGILAMTRQNGDGVIPASAAENDAQRDLINRMTAAVSGAPDLSGQQGVNAAIMAEYRAQLAAELARRTHPDAAFGAKAEFLEAALKAEELIDDFFLRAGMKGFCEAVPEPAAPAASPALKEFLTTAPAAPVEDGILRRDAAFNPIYAETMKDFFAKCDLEALDLPKWQEIRNTLAGYRRWRLIPAPAAGKGMDDDALKAEIENPEYDALNKLFDLDVGAAKIIARKGALRRLLIFQRDMLCFVNNFVNLSAFFTPGAPSALQAGTLVMDARRFTLAVNVSDVAAHKKLAENSNICTVYLKLSGAASGFIGVAVTAGTMRRLFIGKRGIFISRTGQVSDAEIVDLLRQPVSIPEALAQPFISLGRFIAKQADKIMAGNAQNVQKSMETNITASAQPAAPAQGGGQSSMAMMLAGGGIGIAAIGSSVALLARTIRESSPWTIPLVILGIILVFGGPAVVISLIKLHRRNIGAFLEAGSAAVNHPMRMNRRMGKLFCHTPKRPN